MQYSSHFKTFSPHSLFHFCNKSHLAVPQPEDVGGLVGRVDDASQVDRRVLIYEGIAAAQDFREWLCNGGRKEGGEEDQWSDIVYAIY